jgi:transcriptional regulator of aromatic amino acid metabolism
VFTRVTPRNPDAWVAVEAAPVPEWALDYDVLGKALSHLGKSAGTGLIEKARALGATLPPELDDPTTELTPQLIVEVLRDVAWHFFPRLAPVVTSDSQ